MRKRRRVAAGHDDVIEHLHIDELQRALQLAREDLVGPAGLPAERRVVVGQYDGRAVAGERPPDNFPWIDAGLRQSAAEELLPRDESVLRIEEQDREDLIAKARKSGLQERRRPSRAVDDFGCRRLEAIARGQ